MCPWPCSVRCAMYWLSIAWLLICCGALDAYMSWVTIHPWMQAQWSHQQNFCRICESWRVPHLGLENHVLFFQRIHFSRNVKLDLPLPISHCFGIFGTWCLLCCLGFLHGVCEPVCTLVVLYPLQFTCAHGVKLFSWKAPSQHSEWNVCDEFMDASCGESLFYPVGRLYLFYSHENTFRRHKNYWCMLFRRHIFEHCKSKGCIFVFHTYWRFTQQWSRTSATSKVSSITTGPECSATPFPFHWEYYSC